MIDETNDTQKNAVIREAISAFMKEHHSVAVYCNGRHTRVLMSDFVFELKNLVAIIDNNVSDCIASGLPIISDSDIEENGIDGIIISSYRYLDEIKDILRRKHSSVDVLDIYESLENKGNKQYAEYYAKGPYERYLKINSLWNEIDRVEGTEKQKIVFELIKAFVSIKDFRMALCLASELKDQDEYSRFHTLINNLYIEELNAMEKIDNNNVLMLCMDGLRKRDLSPSEMYQTMDVLNKRGCIFERGYAYSTSTYESLVPSFSENTDQKSKYYDKTEVQSDECRFIREALKQKRTVYIYGDGNHYIYDINFKYSNHAQTFSEKIWDFVLDAIEENNGLFYLHELYESHYSYPNPYTKGKMIADGTAMIFDYLPTRGGVLCTNYVSQHADSIRYLDDTLSPLLSRLNCSLLLFADHGNMVLDEGTMLEDINPVELTAGDEWLEIPFCVISPFISSRSENVLISLLDINDIMISLLRNEAFIPKKRRYIKIGRSALYNPDFKWIYSKMGWNRFLREFEGFIFDDGYKLLLFGDGTIELYFEGREELDQNIKSSLIEEIREYISIGVNAW